MLNTATATGLEEFRETFRHWERLRIVFNVVLIAVTCVCVFSQKPEAAWSGEFLAKAVLAGLAANVCYFAGPMTDSYVRWLGFRSALTTYGMFTLGLVFSMAVTIVASLSYVVGDPF